MTDATKTLLLVDGSSYLYRAYHALPDLRAPDGFPTGALHGMVAMLTKALKDWSPALAACVFDAPGRTFRDDLYDQYKAHRAAMPEPLVQQIEPIHEVVRLLGWPVLMLPGIEADDAIGTLARVAAERGLTVVVSTGDKDLAQLVNDHVTLVNTMTSERLDTAGVAAKFGVPPQRIVDYLALIGDAVDNVPGVDKVGPKTAAKWIAEHGSLDGVMAAADTIKGVAGENLRRALPWLPTGRRLVTIATDCDLASAVPGWPALEALRVRAPDRAALLDFYARHGFKTFRREFEEQPTDPGTGATAEPAPASVLVDGETILSIERLDAWIERLAAAPLVAIDVRTDADQPMAAHLVGLALAVSPQQVAYVPLAHRAADAPEQLDRESVIARLAPWLQDARAAKAGHDVKHALHVFANHGLAVQGFVHDTLLQSYVLEAHKPHTLDSLAERHVGRRATSYESLCGKGVHQIAFSQLPVEQAAAYAGERACLVLDVHRVLWPQLQATPGLRTVYADIEMPVTALLARIERHGVQLDAALLARQSHELAQRLLTLERDAHALAGQPFNLGSPKQIGEVLFGRLGLPVKRKTASGAPSTDEDVLTELAADYPLPAKLLEHRSLAKLKGTYTDKLPAMVDPFTGRVHTSYAQAVAVTGRLSSNDPNLQNIPIRTTEGRRIREAFVAPPGHLIASADYSQIELRIMAHISRDPGLLSAFERGIDVHRATAAEVFNVALDAVSAEQRRYAKVINFGLIYGMGAFGLASNLGIEQRAARDYIERYFARFAGVKRYMDATRAQAAEQGYVQTLFGRRIYLPEIRGGSGPRRAAAERQAINAPMQGTAADLIKLAMLAVQRAIDDAGQAARIVMQVHDELVFELPQHEQAWLRDEVPRAMAGVASLAVPLLAEIGFGPNWDAAH